jgi:hypothetical protein
MGPNKVWNQLFSFSVEKVSFWRDFVKLFAHHVFHTPAKPAGLMYHQTVGKLDGSGYDLEFRKLCATISYLWKNFSIC